MVARVDEVLANLDEGRLLEPRRIQGFDETVLSATWHSLEHLGGHAQEIIHMTRLQLGDRYRFAWTPSTPEQGAPGWVRGDWESSGRPSSGPFLVGGSEPGEDLILETTDGSLLLGHRLVRHLLPEQAGGPESFGESGGLHFLVQSGLPRLFVT